MSPAAVSCPGCGALLAFKIGSSAVSVCEHCRSVVARGDRNPEELGKVAALVDRESPLALGVRGNHAGVGFQIVGRVQFAHAAGGAWDEWYAAFHDNRWGWIAEAQGKLYLTFAVEAADTSCIPPFETIAPGQALRLGRDSEPFTVAEVGEATARAAEGEIPYRLVPGRPHRYADLSGERGRFATIQYEGQEGEGSVGLFTGSEVSLAELGIRAAAASHPERQVAGVHLNCPHCGGSLELRAPDRAERVGCPSCGALLDASQGNLRFFAMLGGKKARPTIPLGATGRLDGLELTAIGFLRRHVEKYGTKYFWSEYLLHHPRAGFLWLVESDRHWSLVRPVSTGAVAEAAGSAHFGGKKFKWFQAGEAHVDHVAGEFYWKVAAGDTTETIDYVRAPEILSKEVTFEPRDEPDAGEAGEGSQANRRRDRRTGPRRKRRRGQVREVQWSHGRYVAVEEVESAFGLSGLARPSNIAPNQPFLHRWIYKYWGLFAAAALLLGLLFFVLAPRRQVFLQRFDLTAAGKQGQAASVAFSEPFDLAARENLKVTVESDITNTWLFVEGDLVHEETNVVHSFSVLAEYYQGVEGGEAWSEGSRSASAYLSAVGPGRHTLRLEFQTGPSGGKSATTVRIEQGVPRALNFLLLLGGISFLPLVVGGFHVHFEKRRWEESDAAD